MKHLKHVMGTLFLAGVATVLLSGCDTSPDSNPAARNAAVAWAEAYFNCDFMQAQDYSTPESSKWLSYAASNITEHDLELLHERNAVVTCDDITVTNDTLLLVTLRVRHYLKPAMLGEQAVQADEEGVFNITVVQRDKQWKVRMEGLPQSEKQSRD